MRVNEPSNREDEQCDEAYVQSFRVNERSNRVNERSNRVDEQCDEAYVRRFQAGEQHDEGGRPMPIRQMTSAIRQTTGGSDATVAIIR